MKHSKPLSRRDFLKLAGAGLGSAAIGPFARLRPLPQFPAGDYLARNCTTGPVEIKSRPTDSSSTVRTIYEDEVLTWNREVVGVKPYTINQRWVETPEGFVYAPYMQPVRNLPNPPLAALPEGKAGFWAEVTVPYLDLFMDNPPPRSPWAKDILGLNKNPRLYYSQVVWIDQIKTGDAGQVMYRFNEDGGRPAGVTGGSYGDIFWAEAAGLRPLTLDDISPIHPDVDPKMKIVAVNATVNYQWLSCYEGQREVYFCRCSTGAKFDASGTLVDKWGTPLGEHWTWRKAISIHMSGGSTGAGYDTPAVSWTTLFSGEGVAIHAAFWHNDFGVPRSHGCVNVLPEDAKWIFRWSVPEVSLDQADVQISGPDGTHVRVEEKTLPV